MTDDDIKDLKKDLLQLFMKYNVSIGFTCADCSDTYGLYDDHIVIQDNNSRENCIFRSIPVHIPVAYKA